MKLDNKTLEALGLLQEECAEVIQIISKIRRFGFDSVYMNESNLNRLLDEIQDVNILIGYLNLNNIRSLEQSNEYINAKLNKLKKYTSLYD